jgi:hypothetical protein
VIVREAESQFLGVGCDLLAPHRINFGAIGGHVQEIGGAIGTIGEFPEGMKRRVGRFSLNRA